MAKKFKIISAETHVRPQLKKLKLLTHSKELSKRKENLILSASKAPLFEVIVTEETKSARELRSANLLEDNSIEKGLLLKFNRYVQNELKRLKDDSGVKKNNIKNFKKVKDVVGKKNQDKLSNYADYVHVVLRKNAKNRKDFSPKNVSCKTTAQKSKTPKERSKFRCSPYTTSIDLEEILHGVMSDLKKVVTKRRNRSKSDSQHHDSVVYHSLLEKRAKAPIKKRKVVRKPAPDFKILHEGKVLKGPKSRCSTVRVKLASSVDRSRTYYNQLESDTKDAALTQIQNLPIGESEELASCALTTNAPTIASPKLARIGRSPKHGNIAMNIVKDQLLNEYEKLHAQTKKTYKDNGSPDAKNQYPMNEINVDVSDLGDMTYEKRVRNTILSNKAVNTKHHGASKRVEQDTLKIRKKKKKRTSKCQETKATSSERGTMTNLKGESKKSNLKNTSTNTSPLKRSESEISLRFEPHRKHGHSKGQSYCNIEDPIHATKSLKTNEKSSSKPVEHSPYGRSHRTHRVFPSEHFRDCSTVIETSSLEGYVNSTANKEALSYCDCAVGTTSELCEAVPLRSMIQADPTLSLCSKQIKKVCNADQCKRKSKKKRVSKNTKSGNQLCQHSEGNICNMKDWSCSGYDLEGNVSYTTISSSDSCRFLSDEYSSFDDLPNSAKQPRIFRKYKLHKNSQMSREKSDQRAILNKYRNIMLTNDNLKGQTETKKSIYKSVGPPRPLTLGQYNATTALGRRRKVNGSYEAGCNPPHYNPNSEIKDHIFQAKSVDRSPSSSVYVSKAYNKVSDENQNISQNPPQYQRISNRTFKPLETNFSYNPNIRSFDNNDSTQNNCIQARQFCENLKARANERLKSAQQQYKEYISNEKNRVKYNVINNQRNSIYTSGDYRDVSPLSRQNLYFENRNIVNNINDMKYHNQGKCKDKLTEEETICNNRLSNANCNTILNVITESAEKILQKYGYDSFNKRFEIVQELMQKSNSNNLHPDQNHNLLDPIVKFVENISNIERNYDKSNRFVTKNYLLESNISTNDFKAVENMVHKQIIDYKNSYNVDINQYTNECGSKNVTVEDLETKRKLGEIRTNDRSNTKKINTANSRVYSDVEREVEEAISVYKKSIEPSRNINRNVYFCGGFQNKPFNSSNINNIESYDSKMAKMSIDLVENNFHRKILNTNDNKADYLNHNQYNCKTQQNNMSKEIFDDGYESSKNINKERCDQNEYAASNHQGNSLACSKQCTAKTFLLPNWSPEECSGENCKQFSQCKDVTWDTTINRSGDDNPKYHINYTDHYTKKQLKSGNIFPNQLNSDYHGISQQIEYNANQTIVQTLPLVVPAIKINNSNTTGKPNTLPTRVFFVTDTVKTSDEYYRLNKQLKDFHQLVQKDIQRVDSSDTSHCMSCRVNNSSYYQEQGTKHQLSDHTAITLSGNLLDKFLFSNKKINNLSPQKWEIIKDSNEITSKNISCSNSNLVNPSLVEKFVTYETIDFDDSKIIQTDSAINAHVVKSCAQTKVKATPKHTVKKKIRTKIMISSSSIFDFDSDEREGEKPRGNKSYKKVTPKIKSSIRQTEDKDTSNTSNSWDSEEPIHLKKEILKLAAMQQAVKLKKKLRENRKLRKWIEGKKSFEEEGFRKLLREMKLSQKAYALGSNECRFPNTIPLQDRDKRNPNDETIKVKSSYNSLRSNRKKQKVSRMRIFTNKTHKLERFRKLGYQSPPKYTKLQNCKTVDKLKQDFSDIGCITHQFHSRSRLLPKRNHYDSREADLVFSQNMDIMERCADAFSGYRTSKCRRLLRRPKTSDATTVTGPDMPHQTQTIVQKNCSRFKSHFPEWLPPKPKLLALRTFARSRSRSCASRKGKRSKIAAQVMKHVYKFEQPVILPEITTSPPPPVLRPAPPPPRPATMVPTTNLCDTCERQFAPYLTPVSRGYLHPSNYPRFMLQDPDEPPPVPPSPITTLSPREYDDDQIIEPNQPGISTELFPLTKRSETGVYKYFMYNCQNPTCPVSACKIYSYPDKTKGCLENN